MDRPEVRMRDAVDCIRARESAGERKAWLRPRRIRHCPAPG